LDASRNAERSGLAVGALAAAAALAVHSLVDFNLRLPANALVFACLLGLAAAPREERAGHGGRTMAAALVGLALLLAVGSAWRAWGALRLQRALTTTAPQQQIASLDALLRGHSYLAEGRRARALAWRDWPAAPPGSRLARLLRAERDLRDAIALRPRWGEAWADLGSTLAARGDQPGADAALAQAVALDPTHLGIGAARAEFLARSAGTHAALEELKRLRDANPDWPSAQALVLARRWTREPVLLQALERAR
jgi:tetratricopeptide (TPR) repeat protein